MEENPAAGPNSHAAQQPPPLIRNGGTSTNDFRTSTIPVNITKNRAKLVLVPHTRAPPQGWLARKHIPSISIRIIVYTTSSETVPCPVLQLKEGSTQGLPARAIEQQQIAKIERVSRP